MPFDLSKAVIDAGGWVAAAAIAIGVITLLVRGDLVTGRSAKDALDRETKRGDKATEQLDRNSDIGERLVEANEKLHTQLGVLVHLLSKVLKGPGT